MIDKSCVIISNSLKVISIVINTVIIIAVITAMNVPEIIRDIVAGCWYETLSSRTFILNETCREWKGSTGFFR